VEGDDHGEAYTASMWGVGVSHDSDKVAGDETFQSVEGNMCRAAMRGSDALPGSRATSRMQGARRNLGDLLARPVAGVFHHIAPRPRDVAVSARAPGR
jgi:hypothetical protein